jgi:hypothetical protein
MSQPEFITILIKTDHRARVPVQIPAAEFTALYQSDKNTLRGIAQRYGITVSGVVRAARVLELPLKSTKFQFKRKYYEVDVDTLRRLLEVEKYSIPEAAVAMGISEYLVKLAIFENNLGVQYKRKDRKQRGTPRTRECLPPTWKKSKPCVFLPVCTELEPGGLPLRCEELLEDELPITEYDRDSTPSIGDGGGVPFCSLMR